MSRKKKFTRIVFILNGLLFLLAAFDYASQTLWAFTTLHFTAAMLNLSMIKKFRSEKRKELFSYGILLMNIIVPIALAMDCIAQGKQYIQYAWFLAALMSTVVLILKIIRRKAA